MADSVTRRGPGPARYRVPGRPVAGAGPRRAGPPRPGRAPRGRPPHNPRDRHTRGPRAAAAAELAALAAGPGRRRGRGTGPAPRPPAGRPVLRARDTDPVRARPMPEPDMVLCAPLLRPGRPGPGPGRKRAGRRD